MQTAKHSLGICCTRVFYRDGSSYGSVRRIGLKNKNSVTRAVLRTHGVFLTVLRRAIDSILTLDVPEMS